jgi:hypothetical protein
VFKLGDSYPGQESLLLQDIRDLTNKGQVEKHQGATFFKKFSAYAPKNTHTQKKMNAQQDSSVKLKTHYHIDGTISKIRDRSLHATSS